MANRGLGFHQDATTWDAWFTDLVDTLIAPANGTGWTEYQSSGVIQRRILKHSDGNIWLDLHRKAFDLRWRIDGGRRNTFLEFFLGFADAWDDTNKRPTTAAQVSIMGAPLAGNFDSGGGPDSGSWTGQFYWWIDANGFVALFKPDGGIGGWNNSSQTWLVMLQRFAPGSFEQAGGTNFVAYCTNMDTNLMRENTFARYWGAMDGNRCETNNGGAIQAYWNLSPSSGQPSRPWYVRWPFVHPFGVTTNDALEANQLRTGHYGQRGAIPYASLWPWEQSSEGEGAFTAARRAVGGNDKVYFQFPWFANDHLMSQLLAQPQYFFRGQLSRGLLDGDQVAWVNGAVTQTYLYKILGSFGHGVFIRYA